MRQGSEQNLRVQSNYELLWALFCRLFARFGRQYSDKRSRSVKGITSFCLTRIGIRVIMFPCNKRGGQVKSYSSREVIQMLKAEGWYEVSCVGDHHQFKHDTKPGKVTVVHPEKDLTKDMLKSISKQSGIIFP